jgi:hypothetical protein
MEPTYHDLTRFLKDLGTGDVAHTERNFLAHLVGVYHYMKSWQLSEEVCRVGLFHSIYGTELFRRFCLPLERREDVRALLGERGEFLAYINCVMDRATFDAAAMRAAPPYCVHERETGVVHELSQADFDDLCRVHLCDWLEQVPHSKKWNYRRPAYRRLAERLGGIALREYDRIFALEPVA